MDENREVNVTATTDQLYAVYLGGTPEKGRMGEDHEVVFVVAPDIPTMKRRAKAKWQGTNKPHVDAYEALSAVDGFAIQLVVDGSEQQRVITDDNLVPHN